MAHSRNQEEPVVALLAVLGIRTVEAPATETLITGGLRASKLANVSSRLRACRCIVVQTGQAVTIFAFVLINTHI